MKVGDLIRCLYEDDDGSFAYWGVGVVLKIYESTPGNKIVTALWQDGVVCGCQFNHAEIISEGR